MTSYCPNCRYTEDYKLLDLCPECFSSMVAHPPSSNAPDAFCKEETVNEAGR
jgi:rRNA maturation protein Nop10